MAAFDRPDPKGKKVTAIGQGEKHQAQVSGAAFGSRALIR
jgi:hypothetical protein